jgi:dTDP-glucose 4,6-dehydratase/UDP-glucose 4-epimerase
MAPLASDYDLSSDVDALLCRAGLDVERLRGKCVFVTGATGFFGVWMLTALVRIKRTLCGDLKLVALSRNPDQFLARHPEFEFDRHVDFVVGDVGQFTYPLGDVTHLVHMATTNAAETFAGQGQFSKLDMLYSGTLNVLKQCSGSLESVLMTSSGVAYGNLERDKIVESDQGKVDTTDLRSALALGKLVSEYLVSSFSEQEEYRFSIARCFSFAGPYLPLDLHYAFGNFIRNAQRKENIVIRGDGLDRRSYLYIGDAIAWLLRMLLEPKNKIYNVGSEKDLSVYELAVKIAQIAGHGLKVETLGLAAPKDNFRRPSYLPSTELIRSDYPGLVEWTDVNQVIEKMLVQNPSVLPRTQPASVLG